ncbi:MAG: PadR family transcriptional regulator [Patescibacteria group bacterium]|nr:PadR family transcriptional regulator [Patescibacteria group bacterium]
MDNKIFDMENARAQMRKSLLEYCILLAISQGELYASDILSELKADNLIVVEGTLYPMLSRLKSDSLLEYSWKESKAGPPRKYYRLTGEGKRTLEQLTLTWQELTSSINSLIKKYEKNN